LGPRRRPIEEEEPTVVNATRWVGLDVHASQTACALFDSATGEVATRRVLGRPHEVLDWLLALEAPVRAVYEAGPTGYGLARRGRAAGIDVQVCAPGMIVRSATERIKTDKRDALKLARLFAAGQLALVHVPTLEHEQLRRAVPARCARSCASPARRRPPDSRPGAPARCGAHVLWQLRAREQPATVGDGRRAGLRPGAVDLAADEDAASTATGL
jgi:hypothetical protein